MADPNSVKDEVEVVLAAGTAHSEVSRLPQTHSQLCCDETRTRDGATLSVNDAFRQLVVAVQRELEEEYEDDDEGKQTCCCGLVTKEDLAGCLDDMNDDDDCCCCECCTTCIWYLSFGTREEKLTAFTALLPVLIIVPVYLVRSILAGINDDEDDWWLMYIFAAFFWMMLSWLWMFVIVLVWSALKPLLVWCWDKFPRRGPYEAAPDLCAGGTLFLMFGGVAVGLWFAARKVSSIEVEDDQHSSLGNEFRIMPKVAQMAILTSMCLSSLASVWYLADTLRWIFVNIGCSGCKVDDLTDDDEVESTSNDSPRVSVTF